MKFNNLVQFSNLVGNDTENDVKEKVNKEKMQLKESDFVARKLHTKRRMKSFCPSEWCRSSLPVSIEMSVSACGREIPC